MHVGCQRTDVCDRVADGTGTWKLKFGVRAVGILRSAEAAELVFPNSISLIFLLSSAVRLAVPFAAKKLAS